MPLPSTWSQTGEYFIPYRLLLLARMIERDTARDLAASCGLSMAEWQVLALACTYANVSAADVSATVGTDSAQVSRTVVRMIAADIVKRDYDRNSRKQKKITATEKGVALFERGRAVRQEYYSWILQDLTAEERQHFDTVIKTVAMRVDERRQDAD
jgi:DNA-binding MarR family transcriptional regulator